MVVQEHVRKGGVVTVDANGVVTLKSNEKRYSKESSRVEAMVEARRSDGQGIQVPPKRTESAKARRDRARNTHANYIARQEKRREERQRQAQAAATTAAALPTAIQANEVDVDVVVVDITGESVNEEGTTTAPERRAIVAESGKRRAVETQPDAAETAVAARRGSTREEKRGVEGREAARHKRTTSVRRELSWNFSWEREKAVCTASKAAGTASKGITRSVGSAASESKTVSYTQHIYKALTRGERMLLAAQR